MLKCSKEAFAACPDRHLCGCPNEATFTEGSECDQFNRQIAQRTEGKMATEQRVIDAYKLEDLVRSNSARYHHADDVIAAIAGQPTVDAVEVVRCKDCIRCEKAIHAHAGMVFKCTLFNPKDVRRYKNPDDFCSCGERRTDHV